MYENRKYLIIPASEVSKVDFNEVNETSSGTLRFSIDQTKTFIKWEGDTPSFVSGIVGSEGPYTHAEISQILNTLEWTGPLEEL